MVCSDFSLSLLFGYFTPSTGYGMRLRLVVYEGRIKQGFEKRDCATGPESKAQFDLGTSVPYKSIYSFLYFN